MVADQVRELSVALQHTMHGLADVVDLVLASAPHAEHDGADGTVTVDITVTPPDTRAAVDTLTTIDHLATASGAPSLAVPTDARGLASWIADEVERQTDGHAPMAYAAGRRPAPPPCPLLRTVIDDDLGQPTIHAYRHPGLTARQLTTIRTSPVCAALAARPGATLDQLVAQSSMPRLDLLAELGHLIELRAIFGIGQHWYLYDITVLALYDADSARRGCACPVTTGAAGR